MARSCPKELKTVTEEVARWLRMLPFFPRGPEFASLHPCLMGHNYLGLHLDLTHLKKKTPLICGKHLYVTNTHT